MEPDRARRRDRLIVGPEPLQAVTRPNAGAVADVPPRIGGRLDHFVIFKRAALAVLAPVPSGLNLAVITLAPLEAIGLIGATPFTTRVRFCAASLGDAGAVELTPAAGRSVFDIRAGIIADQAALRAAQAYIKEVCLK
ncbi:Bacteriophage lysis protein [compost metagenome]